MDETEDLEELEEPEELEENDDPLAGLGLREPRDNEPIQVLIPPEWQLSFEVWWRLNKISLNALKARSSHEAGIGRVIQIELNPAKRLSFIEYFAINGAQLFQIPTSDDELPTFGMTIPK